MKSKNLLFVFGLFFTLGSLAQSGISNMSFENWSSTTWGFAPSGWIGINTAQQTTGAHKGNKYVRLTNTSFNQGMLMLGTASTATVLKGGAPISQMPTALNGFVKTSGLASGDFVGVQIYTSDNGTINALGTYTIDTNLSLWTSFSVPLTIFGASSNVDTVYIVATSGKMGPSSGTNSLSATLDVDDFWLEGVNMTGIENVSLGTAFMVYPNPTSDVLHVISKNEEASLIKINGIDGKLITELPIRDERAEIDLKDLATGFYFYTIVDAGNTILLTGRFAVTR